jgi:hypothetical protein
MQLRYQIRNNLGVKCVTLLMFEFMRTTFASGY